MLMLVTRGGQEGCFAVTSASVAPNKMVVIFTTDEVLNDGLCSLLTLSWGHGVSAF